MPATWAPRRSPRARGQVPTGFFSSSLKKKASTCRAGSFLKTPAGRGLEGNYSREEYGGGGGGGGAGGEEEGKGGGGGGGGGVGGERTPTNRKEKLHASAIDASAYPNESRRRRASTSIADAQPTPTATLVLTPRATAGCAALAARFVSPPRRPAARRSRCDHHDGRWRGARAHLVRSSARRG